MFLKCGRSLCFIAWLLVVLDTVEFFASQSVAFSFSGDLFLSYCLEKFLSVLLPSSRFQPPTLQPGMFTQFPCTRSLCTTHMYCHRKELAGVCRLGCVLGAPGGNNPSFQLTYEGLKFVNRSACIFLPLSMTDSLFFCCSARIETAVDHYFPRKTLLMSDIYFIQVSLCPELSNPQGKPFLCNVI